MLNALADAQIKRLETENERLREAGKVLMAEAARKTNIADRLEAEIARLRNIIGELYVARGGSKNELYTAIKRAFFESRADAPQQHQEPEVTG